MTAAVAPQVRPRRRVWGWRWLALLLALDACGHAPIWVAVSIQEVRGGDATSALVVILWMAWFEILMIRRLWKTPDAKFSAGGCLLAGIALIFKAGIAAALSLVPFFAVAG